VSLLSKIVGRNRIRKAARELAWDPSPRNYVTLAREHVIAGNPEEVLRVCMEGLQLHPGVAELRSLGDRAQQIRLDKQIRGLQQDLKHSARPAIWRELCEALIAAGKPDRADDVARQWHSTSSEPEAVFYRAFTAAELFFHDHQAKDGQEAYDFAEEAHKLMRQDSRPLELQLSITTRCGAWQEARRCLAKLLELKPGEPELEAQFRSVLSMCDGAKSLEFLLQRVERSGRFADDKPDLSRETARVAVRPMLKELSSDSEVRAAVYLRGGTALVQGPRGATADRTARAVRELIVSCRSAARRMKLGRPVEVLLEGDFGSLVLLPGEQGSAALWCRGPIKRRHEDMLATLSGMSHLVGGPGGIG